MVQLVTLIQVGHCHVKHIWCVTFILGRTVSKLIKLILLFQLQTVELLYYFS